MLSVVLSMCALVAVDTAHVPFPPRASLAADGRTPFDASLAVTMPERQRWYADEEVQTIYQFDSLCDPVGPQIVVVHGPGSSQMVRTYWHLEPRLEEIVDHPWRTVLGRLFPFDYDGSAPMEQVSSSGVVWACTDSVSPHAIDTVGCWPRRSSERLQDIDDDGVMDLVTFLDTAVVVTFGGPAYTSTSCARTAMIPLPFRAYAPPESQTLMSTLLRCTDGVLRAVVVGQVGYGRRGLYLVDISLQRHGDEFHTTVSIVDSISFRNTGRTPSEWWIARPLMVVNDDVAGRQYFIAKWQDGFHPNLGGAVAVYDISDGTLDERIATDVLSNDWLDFGNTVDDGPAVIAFHRDTSWYFSRVTELHRPFARILAKSRTAHGYFIPDQYANGAKDLLLNHAGLRMYDFVPTATTSIAHATEPVEPAMSLRHRTLVLTGYDAPEEPHFYLTSLTGVTRRIYPVHQGGLSGTYDLSPGLDGLAAGPYIVSVRIAGVVRSVPLVVY